VRVPLFSPPPRHRTPPRRCPHRNATTPTRTATPPRRPACSPTRWRQRPSVNGSGPLFLFLGGAATHAATTAAAVSPSAARVERTRLGVAPACAATEMRSDWACDEDTPPTVVPHAAAVGTHSGLGVSPPPPFGSAPPCSSSSVALDVAPGSMRPCAARERVAKLCAPNNSAPHAVGAGHDTRTTAAAGSQKSERLSAEAGAPAAAVAARWAAEQRGASPNVRQRTRARGGGQRYVPHAPPRRAAAGVAVRLACTTTALCTAAQRRASHVRTADGGGAQTRSGRSARWAAGGHAR
jgi:hypothetical protein